MSKSFVRVPVSGPQGSTDVCLPSDEPIGGMVVMLMHLTGASATDIADPGAWALSTLIDGPIDLTKTPAESQLLDGTKLYLTRTEEAAEPAFVDDVLHRLGTTSGSAFSVWRGIDRRRAVTILVAVALSAVSVLVSFTAQGVGSAVTLAVAGFAALGVGRMFVAREAAWVGWAAIAALAGACRLFASEYSDQSPALWWFVGAAVGVGAIGLLSLRVPHTVGIIGFALAIALSLVGLSIEWGASLVAVSAWSLIPFLLVFAIAPKTALATSGIVAMVRRAEDGEPVHRDELRERLESTQQSTDVLVWVAAVLSALACVVLTVTGVWIQGVLSLLVAATLALNSRAFTHTRHVAPMVGAAIISASAGTLALPGWLGMEGGAAQVAGLAAVAALLLAIVAFNSVELDDVSAVRLTRVLNAVDYPIVLGTFPMIFAAQGVYQLFWPS